MANRRLGKENRKRTSITIDPVVWKILDELSKKEDRSVSWYIHKALIDYLERRNLLPEDEG